MAQVNAFGSLQIPSIQGRRALLVINCQKDAFVSTAPGGSNMCNPPDFLERIRKIIPYYRKTETDIIWVRTEPPTKAGKDNLTWDNTFYLTHSPSSTNDGPSNSAEANNEQDAQKGHLKLQRPLNIPPWPKTEGGSELVDELKDLVDPDKDLVLIKNYFSAYDETQLLMSLRMKMVTDVHLCGGFSNVSIIYTAQEAVQHGFEVSVVEDCLGYRAEKDHLAAMLTMADELGVHGVDSAEIIEEAGGVPPPDADPDIISGPGFDGINVSSHQMKSQHSIQVDSMPITAEPSDSNMVTPKDPILAPGTLRDGAYAKNKIGEGDCQVISNALSPNLVSDAFEKLKSEVEWRTMKHRTGDVPRRVAVQGDIGTDGAVPIYRHPADECPPLMPFTQTVLAIRTEVSKLLNQHFNHVLIQLYRSGQDHISEHSDKTLDIVRGSNIINVSFGAQRKMTLRIKKSSQTREAQMRGDRREGQKVTLPHNSVFVLGPTTNKRWLHGVRPDKRLTTEKSEAETAYGGERISLTFRNIGTWTDKDRKWIWGQGAKKKTVGEMESNAGNVKAPDSEEAEEMLVAFGHENHQVDFDWDKEYGKGFDALDFLLINGLTS